MGESSEVDGHGTQEFRVYEEQLADSVLCRWQVAGSRGVVELKAKRFEHKNIADELDSPDFGIADGPDTVWVPLDVGVHSLDQPHDTPEPATVSKWSHVLQAGPAYFAGWTEEAAPIIRAWLAASRDDMIIERALQRIYQRHLARLDVQP